MSATEFVNSTSGLLAALGTLFLGLAALITAIARIIRKRVKPPPNIEATKQTRLLQSVIPLSVLGILLLVVSITILSARAGPPQPVGQVFSVSSNYTPSGIMGDVGDVYIAGEVFSYKPRGLGPHEWDWKYRAGAELNDRPAMFAGVMWLSPPNAWGTDPKGGWNLRGFKRIRWKARSTGDPINVEFVVGGVNWQWSAAAAGVKETAPFPDTMPRTSLGVKHLTSEWQTFEFQLAGLPVESLKRVVGGFAWVASWGGNGIQPDDSGLHPTALRDFTFEVSDIRYER